MHRYSGTLVAKPELRKTYTTMAYKAKSMGYQTITYSGVAA